MNDLKIADASFRYPSQSRRVFENIDFEMKQGEVLLVTGRSGCGKSTLARTVANLSGHGFSTGRIFYEGREVSYIPGHELASKRGYLQQDPESQMVSLSVEDEVAFLCENLCMEPSSISKRCKEALDAVGGSHLLHRQTWSLSGGEMQKVALASILSARPGLLILDEPTANLDEDAARSFSVALEKVKRKGTMLFLVEQRIDRVLPVVDRIGLLHKGSLHINNLEEGLDAVSRQGVRIPGSLTGARPKKGSQRTRLKVKSLQVTRGGKEILRDASLNINRGDIIALTGKNGSGKTTFGLSLLNLVKKSGGTVQLNGNNITNKTTSAIAKRVGFVFQNPLHQLFCPTVFKEASLAPRNFGMNDWRSRGKSALLHMGLQEYENRPPLSLSHGQKRRLNLASVLSYNPPVLFLDEPFIGQDINCIRGIARVLKSHSSRGGAVIIVVHDEEIARYLCNRIIRVENGFLEEVCHDDTNPNTNGSGVGGTK
ncbi:MAG TPA: ABC transporter ATP-binding protein [Euryarchaeota archaeon]|nr:ABC transporter ATP-binding protein [Euryarchaeota archaeon]